MVLPEAENRTNHRLVRMDTHAYTTPHAHTPNRMHTHTNTHTHTPTHHTHIARTHTAHTYTHRTHIHTPHARTHIAHTSHTHTHIARTHTHTPHALTHTRTTRTHTPPPPPHTHTLFVSQCKQCVCVCVHACMCMHACVRVCQGWVQIRICIPNYFVFLFELKITKGCMFAFDLYLQTHKNYHFTNKGKALPDINWLTSLDRMLFTPVNYGQAGLRKLVYSHPGQTLALMQ